jgi:uncharacterized protein
MIRRGRGPSFEPEHRSLTWRNAAQVFLCRLLARLGLKRVRSMVLRGVHVLGVLACLAFLPAGMLEARSEPAAQFFSKISSQEIAKIRADADAGNVDAIFLLLLYLTKDEETSEIDSLRERAAAAGHPFALYDQCVLEAFGAEPSTDNCVKAALLGDPRAQSFIGFRLSLGLLGLREDPETALWFYRKAALQGYASALARVGDKYHHGLGVKKDDELAAHYWGRAASMDQVSALRELGRAYGLGRGVPRDLNKALKYLNRAADFGDGAAQYYAGLTNFVNGKYQNAYVMYTLAIKALSPGERRDGALKERAKLDRRLSQSEIKRAKSIAAGWKKLAPKQQAFIGGTEFTKRLQAALNQGGFNAGEHDGLAGAQTKAAYRKYADSLQLGDVRFAKPDIFYVAYRLNLFGTTDELTEPPTAGADLLPGDKGPDDHTGPSTPAKSGGSGFAVNSEGIVVTNAHVVKECASVRIVDERGEQTPAAIVHVSEFSDLAVLKVASTTAEPIGFRSGTPPRLGESIIVFGFPLTGVLSDDGNLTVGNLTALAGIRGDPSVFQISAPVQPGNSGGPVLDSRGQLVGIVVGKLNAIAVADVTDDIPQNVNFAIKSTVLENLLQSLSIEYKRDEPNSPELSVPDLAERAKNATVMVECVGP